MTTAGAVQHLERFFAAWQRHDPTELAAFYAVDAQMEDPMLTRPISGREGIRDYYANVFATLDHPFHELLDYAANGTRVWFEWTFGDGDARSRRVVHHGISIQTLNDDGLIAHDFSTWTPNER